MLAISELVALADTVDADGSSPVALALAAHWGCDSARFVRSSASHVFDCGSLFLRFRPRAAAGPDVSGAASTLVSAGAPLAPPVRALDGRLRVVQGGYAATAVSAVRGRQVEAETLSPGEARWWGQSLARLHEAGMKTGDRDLPVWLEEVRAADPGIAAEVEALPRSSSLYGVVHGDPELDNVVWREDDPAFVDLDDLARSWFAADVCFALRDFAPRGRAPDLGVEPMATFLRGYSEIRPLTQDELDAMPLFARAHAAVTLHRLRDVLAEQSDPGWPEWARMLRARVEAVAAELREAAV